MPQGKCNCGTVNFRVETELTQIFMCHCSICRKSSGSNGIAVVIVPNTEFHWLSGKDNITHWKKPDAHDWEGWFCRTCGSPLPGKNDDAHIFVPAGLFGEDIDHLKVTHHIWVGSKAGWDEIGGLGKQHMEAFKG
ncbi:GFA family protein [Kordiimonas sp. SCSIO 12603]|uniref:GFA family protein n=1 Tax=Kordiimonas sp. SCSIO 12603 TaxID=2829596 RepID=UPI002103266B|nr:GFA family protein [Kordiimonas sp. SCSIO 12603]UTW57116.1 GFA family protein [Kordiimonas sp. SCSIO 12603]